MAFNNSNYDDKMGLFGDPEDPEAQAGMSSKKKQLARKRGRVEDAKKLRKDNKIDEKWSRFIQLYSGTYPYPELGDYEDQVVPNMIFSTVNVVVPSVAVHSPKITVTARREQDVETASVVEAVVNHQWAQYDVQNQIVQAVKDFVILGLGWLKVTWDVKTAERPLTVEEWQALAQERLMEKATALQGSTLGADEFPSDDEILSSIETEITEVVKDAPLVTRVSPFDVFVDPDATRIEDARWICHRVLVPIQVAKKNPAYKESARRKLKATRMSDARKDVEYSAESVDTSKEAGFAEIYEFYDLVDGTSCTFAAGCDDYLIESTKTTFPNGHPFVFLANYEVPERFYPIGDVEMIYGLQLELALTRTAMANDRKRGRRIHLARSSSLGEDGMQDLQSGADNVILDVLEDRPFTDVFQTVSPTGLPPEWYGQSELIQQDIDLVSGVSEYARGAMPEIRRTATEAGLIQDAANARSADKLYRVEQAMAQVAERMIVLSQMFMDTEDVARIVDDGQVIGWQPYDRSNIQGEFVFMVEAGSSQPQNESFRRQSAMQMMDALGVFMEMGVINPMTMADHLLRTFGVKDTTNWIQPPPPPEPQISEEIPQEGLTGGGAPAMM